MRPLVLPNKDTYMRSIERFTANLKGKFKQLAQARASPSYFPPVTLPQGVQPVKRPVPLVPGMSAAVPAPAASSAHNLTAGLSSRPAASFSATQTAALHSFVPSAGLASAAGSHCVPLGQAVASQPAAARPASMVHSQGQFNIGNQSAHPVVQQHM